MNKIKLEGDLKYIITRNVSGQLNMIISDVKFTFFEFPYNIQPFVNFENYIKLPTLIDLAAMKAFALGRRSKWKDYVDLYFIIKDHFTIKQISQRAEQVFEQQFSEKLFRSQLSYFKDIDFSEQVKYLVEPVDEELIKNFLIEKAIEIEI
ncbi:MAG: nucleotidyl transferase AbiEii/AbiGii toxin family protein [Paludibacter sp.]|nr:nucleotidyl transferase AbiEii/AbiGii toxin family protein [Paludibacter sp.]